MKDYRNYMDSLYVEEGLHRKIIDRISQASTCKDRGRSKVRKYIPILVATAIVLVLFIGIHSRLTKIWNTIPNEGNSSSHQINVDTMDQASVVYHDIDLSQLVRKGSLSKVPHGFYFSDRLVRLAPMDPSAINNGLRWQEHKYTGSEIEEALKISVKEPDLPRGDYTREQYVLIDDANKNIIAYQTSYYYFNKNTMEFENRFSIFYFAEKDFKSDEFEEMKDLIIVDKKISLSDLPKPLDVHVKMPHVRKLAYIENGILLVIEAEAEFVGKNNVVHKEASLDRYQETDRRLVDIMKSIIDK